MLVHLQAVWIDSRVGVPQLLDSMQPVQNSMAQFGESKFEWYFQNFVEVY
jgi:hypothetical protein